MIELVVVVNPKPCTRPRFNRNSGRAYHDSKYITYRRDLELALREVWTKAPLDVPCRVEILCFGRRPKTTKLPFPKPDVDNYAKGVLDAMQGQKDAAKIILEDDWIVKRLEVEKFWAAPDDPGRIVINIEAME